MKSTLVYFTLLLLCFTIKSYAQEKEETIPSSNLGISLQAYPAGFIPTINYENYIDQNSSLVYRLGANIVDRQDFSDENDEETGFGFGGSFGYRRYFAESKTGAFSLGLNLDLWNLWIDWKDNLNTANPTSGNTYTLVLQPWLEGGYFFNLNNGKSEIGITAGFGREFNVITNGDDVEQGFIGSLILQYKLSL